jgi:hypothetical protein
LATPYSNQRQGGKSRHVCFDLPVAGHFFDKLNGIPRGRVSVLATIGVLIESPFANEMPSDIDPSEYVNLTDAAI